MMMGAHVRHRRRPFRFFFLQKASKTKEIDYVDVRNQLRSSGVLALLERIFYLFQLVIDR